jgi:hypothetical protein
MARNKTRRDVRVLFEKAVWCRHLDHREEAIAMFHEVLRRDARDPHCCRYWLAASLLDLQRHDELRQLLERCDEPTALWRFAQALLAFRLGGDSDDARRLLEEASRRGAGFLDYLLGDSLIYADREVRFGGDPQETDHSMAALFLPAWRATPGAATWARRVLKVPLAGSTAQLPFPRQELARLPQRDVTWQLGLRLLDKDKPASAEDLIWGLGIANVDDELLLQMTVVEGEATAEAVWHGLLSAFLQPVDGEPHRPARLEVPRADFCRNWGPILEEISVHCEFERDPQPIGRMLEGMAEMVRERQLPTLRDDLDPREFPQVGQVWQANFFHMPIMITNEQVGVERPWAAMVVDRESSYILSSELIPGEPTCEKLWENLLRIMARPGPGGRARPSRIEVSDSDCYDFLKAKLGEIGVACALRDALPVLAQVCQSFATSFGGPEKCALADGAGVTSEQMDSFYYAAAGYFERAPWKHVPGEIPIEIRCTGLNMGVMYAIVLGRTGVTMGLAIYRDWNKVLAMLRGLAKNGDMSGFSVVFDEVAILAPADLYLVERNGWPIRTPEAYPAIMRHEPGRQPHSPSGEELDYIDGCLRVIPDFLTSGKRTKTFQVAVNGKQVKMRLAWTIPTR